MRTTRHPGHPGPADRLRPGLANQIESVYTAGGGEVVYKEFYDLSQTEYSAEIAALVQADPDAFVLVSYDEARSIIPALVNAGFSPQDKQFYFVDGNRLDYSEFDEGLMEGTKATQPIGSTDQSALIARVEEYHGDKLPEIAYVPGVLRRDDPDRAGGDLRQHRRSGRPPGAHDQVTNGDNECNTFADRKGLLGGR